MVPEGLVRSLYAHADDANASPLRDLLAVIARELETVGTEVERLYDDLFVETDQGWAVPYLGDLIRGTLAAGAGKDPKVALAELARASVERFEEDVRSIPPEWWPGGLAERALAFRWKTGVAAAVADERFVDATYRALRGPWRAFRGVRVEIERYEEALGAAAPLLPALEHVTIAGFDAGAHLGPLLQVFRAIADVKPTEAKWVSTSKTLYFLLPDLVPPIDNAFTVPFLRRAGIRMRPGIDRETLAAAFGVLSRLARLAGARRLRELSSDPRYSTPIGLARVVDFAIAGRALRSPAATR